MAKQTVNLGTSPNKGDGDPIRTAMGKINDNFDELYAGNFADPENTAASIIPSQDGTYDIGSADKQWADLYVKDFIYIGGVRLEASAGTILIGGDVVAREDTVGSLFGDDSTLLVDGVNNTINLDGTVSGDIIPDTDVAYDLGSASKRFRDIYLSGSTIDLGGLEISNVGGELQLGGVKIITQSELDVAVQNDITTNLTGSVFADDSTLLVDSVNGRIVGPVENTAITTNTITGRSDLTLVGANGDTDGGTVVVVGGIGNGGEGGDITLAAGIGSAGIGGEVTIAGGIGSTDGGEVTITGGIGSAGEGGPVSISGGSGGTDGGDVTIYAGVGGTGNGVINIGTFNTSAVNITNAVITGDLTGSVFGDDSTVLVDGVNGNVTANILTSNTASNFNGTLSVVGVTRLYDDLIIDGGDIVSNNSAYFFGNLECSNITNLQNNAFASDDLTLSAEGNIILNSTVKTDVITSINGTLNINGNVDFGNSGNIDFTGANVQNFAPGDIYANSGQYLYVVGKYDGGSATNVAFIYDDINNRPRQIFYGKTEFANNGQAAIVDMQGAGQVYISNPSGAVDLYGTVEFNNGTTSFQSGNSVDFLCPVDFTNATFTGEPWISVADLKTLVAASTNFADFQARIAAL